MTIQMSPSVQIPQVQIEVFSDVVCPWCFIGKRRLERALEQLAAAEERRLRVAVRWRAFQLNPWLPPTGMDRAEYVSRKFGTAGSGIYARVAEVGAQVGIPFAFERIVRQPNTVDAHRLIGLADQEGRQDEMVEVLFKAYFLQGCDLTDPAVLTELAERAGLDPRAAQACLQDERARAAVLDEDRQGRELGVEGVPFFVFDRKVAVSGAQDAQVLLRAIDRVARDAAQPVQ